MSSLGNALSDTANAGRDSSAYREAPDPTSMSAFGLQWTLVEEGVERFAAPAAPADTQSAAAPASTAPACGEIPGKYDDIINL